VINITFTGAIILLPNRVLRVDFTLMVTYILAVVACMNRDNYEYYYHDVSIIADQCF